MKAQDRRDKIGAARQTIKRLLAETSRDVRRLKKEQQKERQGDKTDSSSPYTLIHDNNYSHTQMLAEYLDIILKDVGIDGALAAIMSIRMWTNNTYTVAQVRLPGDDVGKWGVGVTKRCPTDAKNTEIGARLAVRRALVDWKEKS